MSPVPHGELEAMPHGAAFGGARLDLEIRGARQRSQQAVEDAAQQVRAQRHGQRSLEPDDGHARLESRRVFVHLRDQLVAAQLDDFAEQAALADGERLEDAEGPRGAGLEHRAADPGDACFAHGAGSASPRRGPTLELGEQFGGDALAGGQQARERGVDAGVARADAESGAQAVRLP